MRQSRGLLTSPIRETNLPRVAQHDLTGVEVGFSDVGEISGRVAVPARPAFEVHGIGAHCVETRSYLGRGSGLRLE